MKTFFSFIAGLIFGVGLIIAGMANPAKVLGFLDLAGAWDPSLGLVMAGAIAVGSLTFAFAKHRSQTLLGDVLQWPSKRNIDTRLVAGSALFGIGWGIAGICPGPALVLLGTGSVKGLIFTAAMLVGMGAFILLESITPKTPTPQT
jgi:uncharacterized protein